MKKVSIDDVEPVAVGIDGERRGLSGALGTTDFAINHYRLAPGEEFPGGLHAHEDQEELFVVVEGEATFETLTPRGSEREGETVTVGETEAIRFAPGEFQSGRNDADRDLVAFAMGAPRDSDDVRIPVGCPECGHDDLRLNASEDGTEFVCPECGAERVPRACPECNGDDLRVTLGDGARTVVVCRDCGAEFEDPPFRE